MPAPAGPHAPRRPSLAASEEKAVGGKASRFACLAGTLLACACACARGQVGGSVSVESDHRFRGVSLSGGEPDLRLSLAYDHASGAYLGASLTGVTPDDGRRRAALTGYAGYAKRTVEGWVWETGATLAHFAGDSRDDYGEAFAGLIAERWSTRLYFSPDYFGRGVRTAYAELDAGWPLAQSLHLFGHLGALAVLGGNRDAAGGRMRYDAAWGASLRMDAYLLRLAWSGSSGAGPYSPAYEQRRSAVVVSASYSF